MSVRIHRVGKDKISPEVMRTLDVRVKSWDYDKFDVYPVPDSNNLDIKCRNTKTGVEEQYALVRTPVLEDYDPFDVKGYATGDIEFDLEMLLEDFGPEDELVKEYQSELNRRKIWEMQSRKS